MKPVNYIVSTKVLPDDLLRQLQLAGFEVTHRDFIQKMINLPPYLDKKNIYPTIVITSKTGVEAFVTIANELSLNLTDCVIFCLEGATLKLVQNFNLNVIGTAKDASSLAELIGSKLVVGTSLTYVCGNLRREELPAKLRLKGICVDEIVGYKTIFTSSKLNTPCGGVLFFSPSAIDSFILSNNVNGVDAFCLGNTTATHAEQYGFASIQIAKHHTLQSLIEEVIKHYKQLPFDD